MRPDADEGEKRTNEIGTIVPLLETLPDIAGLTVTADALLIRLLAEVDETLGGLCGPTTRRVMRRQYEVFGDERFERLAGLSNSHLYRIRQSTTYRRRRNPTTKTQATTGNVLDMAGWPRAVAPPEIVG